jgi:predicted  nucleic acid-binding Zn-ribbon protein
MEKRRVRNDRIKDHNNTLQRRKAEVQEGREARRAELKEKLSRVKDERKREVVERLVEKFGTANDRMTDRLSDGLARMEAVLRRIEEHADTLEVDGSDTANVRTAITNATNAIDAARAAIATQAGNVYSLADVVTTEDTLRANIGGVRSRMNADLRSVRDTVLGVRDEIKEAANALRSAA